MAFPGNIVDPFFTRVTFDHIYTLSLLKYTHNASQPGHPYIHSTTVLCDTDCIGEPQDLVRLDEDEDEVADSDNEEGSISGLGTRDEDTQEVIISGLDDQKGLVHHELEKSCGCPVTFLGR